MFPANGIDNLKVIDEALLGIFGELRNGTADVAVGSIGINTERFQKFSFAFSLLRRRYVAVIHQDQLISVDSSEFISYVLGALFQSELWILILITLCLMSFFGALFEISGHTDKVCSAKSVLKAWKNWIFRMFGTGMGIQGIGKLLSILEEL
jgi:hypothetical protein